MKKNKPTKLKEYTTNIKPSDITYTTLQRESLSAEILNNELKVFSEDENNNLIDLNNVGNTEVIEVAKDLSNLQYRIENPYITDLCSSLYTMLTTLQYQELKKICKNITTTKNHSVRFWIEKNTLIRISLGKIINENTNAINGAYKVKKYVMSLLNPILKGTSVVPKQMISLNGYKLSNGEIKNFLIRTTPIRILDSITDKDTGIEMVEVELNGLFYPIVKKDGKYISATNYLHTTPNLSIVLSIGEDIYLQSEEYKNQKKPVKTKVEVARRFIDLLQISYNQPHNLPSTNGKLKGNKYQLEVWDDTLKSLYPSAFRNIKRGKIFKNEFENIANLASKYFHLGLKHLNSSSSTKENEYLLLPAETGFCRFIPNTNKAIFTAYTK